MDYSTGNKLLIKSLKKVSLEELGAINNRRDVYAMLLKWRTIIKQKLQSITNEQDNQFMMLT